MKTNGARILEALGVAFAWTPQVIEVVRTYEVDLVKVQPVVALNAEPPMPAAKQAEPCFPGRIGQADVERFSC